MKILPAFIFLAVYTFNSHAQDPIDSILLNKKQRTKQYFNSYLNDSRDILIAPVHWNTRQWLTAAGVAGIGAFIYTYDRQIQEFIQKNRTGFTNDLSRYGFEPWGSGVYSVSAIGVLYLNGAIFKNQKSKDVALLSLKAFTLAAIGVQIPKLLFQRHRPGGEPYNPYQFEGPFGNFSNRSFFSGHTMVAFSVATVIATAYKDKKIIPPLVYSLATLAGLSRIHDNKHWASDVFLGAAFGIAVGKLVYNHNNWGIKMVPVASGNMTGVVVTIPLG